MTKGKEKVEIYNIVTDPSESNDIAAQHPELVEKAETRFAEAHDDSPIFPFVGMDVK